METISPATLLRAYAAGLFPMAQSRHARTLHWIDPEWRGVLPLDQVHVPKRLARTIRQDRFTVTVNRCFAQVMRACAEPAPGREQTWINGQILSLYNALHRQGHAHSVETWFDGHLVGGLYGVSLKGAFFGESMFSRMTDASKVALIHLCARLRAGGYVLLDTQFITGHLTQFGTIEIPRRDYLQRLADALETDADFMRMPDYRKSGSAVSASASSAPVSSDGSGSPGEIAASVPGSTNGVSYDPSGRGLVNGTNPASTGVPGADANSATTGPGALVLQVITQTS